VAGKPTAEPCLKAPRLQVDVVVDDEQRARLDLEEASSLAHRVAGHIHVRLGLQEREP
jgi:hypothetical protein